ncbi:glycosyltransferase [Roseibacillus persicicus]|uniref:glycosyltransferase n=1 Tax=Roseibacillus persicicus TaxID=454148 RepID=UPI0028106EC0|nr:glycosyltransferase [Roseibacillus persicicus]MDQ8190603.1 glycosyltransferase [Roseibacillus persicicus]
MKVLHVTSSIDPEAGGVSHVVRNLAPNLEKTGLKNEILTLDSPSQSFLSDESLIVHALGPGKSSWAYSSELLPWFRQHLSHFQAVILHGLWQYPGYALLKAVSKIRKSSGDAPQVLIFPHGMLDPWFQNDPSRRLKALRNEVYWRVFERRVVNDADGLLFTCEEEKLLAQTTFSGFRPQGEHVVGYGIEEPPDDSSTLRMAFAQACPNLPSEQPYLLFLSRIHPKKGVELLLKAYGKLLAERKDLPALVIAGPLDGDYADEMKRLAEKITEDVGRPAQIYFTGMLQGDAKWGALYGCQVFVLPSHQENFGIAVVEALACGKKVLITNKVNIWREIDEAGAGWVGDDTLEGAEEGLVRVLSEADLSSEAAMACYRENFSVEGAARQLKAVITR